MKVELLVTIHGERHTLTLAEVQALRTQLNTLLAAARSPHRRYPKRPGQLEPVLPA